MQRQEQTNTFQDGIISDMHPLSATNTSMTDALNATIVTYNGNEMILQNDMGNVKLFEDKEQIKPVKLTDGFEPIGVKEHGGILYIASINKEGYFELGSFPGPEFQEPKKELKVYALKPKELSETNPPEFTTSCYDEVLPEIFNDEVGTVIENSNLYKTIPLVDSTGSNCVLKVGQEYKIKVGENKDISTHSETKLYKLKFDNLNNGREITNNIKEGVDYDIILNTVNPDKIDSKYFPNIANTKLGVSFEFEKIKTFNLGRTYKIINDEEEGVSVEEKDILFDDNGKPTPDPEYNGSRYPQLTKDFDIIFQSLEYETESEVKVTHFYIQWELTSKTTKNIETGHFYGELFPKNENLKIDKNVYKLKYTKQVGNNITEADNPDHLCIIKPKQGDNQYKLKYTIYPIWKQEGINSSGENKSCYIFDCFINNKLNIHNDYLKTHYIKRVEADIDLTLNPSLWGSTAQYVAAELEPRYLSGNHFMSNSDQKDIIKLGITGWEYDFLENADKIKNVWDGTEEEQFNFSRQEYSITRDDKLKPIEQALNDNTSYRAYQYIGTYDKSSKNTLNNLEYFNLKTGIIKGSLGLKENTQIYSIENKGGNTQSTLPFKIQKMDEGMCVIHPYYKTYNIKLGNVEILNQELKVDHTYWNIYKSFKGLNPLVEAGLNVVNQSSYYLYKDSTYNTEKNKKYTIPLLEQPEINQQINLLKNSLDLKISTTVIGPQGKVNNSNLTFYNKTDSDIHMLDQFIIVNCKWNTPRYDNNQCLLENERIDYNGLRNCLGNSNWGGFGNESKLNDYLLSCDEFPADAEPQGPGRWGQFNSWLYKIDCTDQNVEGKIKERIHLELKNNLDSKYVPYLIRSRKKESEDRHVDSFDNISNVTSVSKSYYPINEFENINANNSQFNRKNKKGLELGNNVSVLTPFVINQNKQPYNYVTIDKENQQFTYEFENIDSKYVNIRFYLQKDYIKSNLGIKSEDFNIEKIYIQGENSDTTELSNISKINSDVFGKDYFTYKLVQIIGTPINSNIKLTFNLVGNSNGVFTIRNLTAYEQYDSNSYKTYAICTYLGTRNLYVNSVASFKVGEDYNTCCYLPEPNYFIDQNNPTFTVTDEGYAKINNIETKIKIIQ